MWLVILKWICFILVCTDVVFHIINKPNEIKGEGCAVFIAFLAGVAARVFVLYGALTCWLLA